MGQSSQRVLCGFMLSTLRLYMEKAIFSSMKNICLSNLCCTNDKSAIAITAMLVTL